MEDYNKQAKDFLKKNKAVLTIKYDRQEDRFNSGTPTDVYICELSNERETYTFDFSQSIASSNLYEFKNMVDYHRDLNNVMLKNTIYKAIGAKGAVSFDHLYLTTSQVELIKEAVKGVNYALRGKVLDKIMNDSFIKNEASAPTEYDVLACLSPHEVADFADFVEEFGYELDSADKIRKAQKTYHAVKMESNALNDLFNEDQINELCEIQ